MKKKSKKMRSKSKFMTADDINEMYTKLETMYDCFDEHYDKREEKAKLRERGQCFLTTPKFCCKRKPHRSEDMFKKFEKEIQKELEKNKRRDDAYC
ncbi:uncharacterized protein LOC103519058 isoform X2 [Diaphorina citri]|uniref:Uncharacterized protein LOC103519058 isoform X2 n=1 Tax=Diaphorina citri TaxID=121845 RepID=A0A1S3DJR5_DIACI|nr:uncharacterized protein LOC103519058 isoform X2 [Diaphorina citri]